MIELLVSIFIIGAVSALFLANYNYTRKAGQVRITAQKLVSDIRKVQGYAFALRDFNGISPQGGWGLHFDANTDEISVFADYHGGGGTDDPPNHLFETTDELSEKIVLPDSVGVGGISINGGASVNNVNIIFEPPNPLVYICTNNDPCDVLGTHTSTTSEVAIDIVGNDGTTRTILVNALGLVDVSN